MSGTQRGGKIIPFPSEKTGLPGDGNKEFCDRGRPGKRCQYWRPVASSNMNWWGCHYILDTGHSNGYAAGKVTGKCKKFKEEKEGKAL